MMASTAAQALERFERTSTDDLAITYFYEGKTPRQHPSAILRAIGDELKGAADCPPRIMPPWLAKAAGPLFDARVRNGVDIFPPGAAQLLADPDPNYDRYQYLSIKDGCIAVAQLADGLVDCLARVAP